MKILISDLTDNERSQLIENILAQRGEDFKDWCVAMNAPILGCFAIESSNEGPGYWLNLVSGGDPSVMQEVIQKSSELAIEQMSRGFGSSIPSGRTPELIVGKWYGCTNGDSDDICRMFKYNGESSGRIGWDELGRWSNNLDDSLDEFARLVPRGIMPLAFAAEASRRGYKLGVDTIHGVIESSEIEHEYVNTDVEECFYFHNIKVYREGSWNHCRVVNGEQDELIKAQNRLRDILGDLGISLN
jgi:hypothetical protein